MELDFELAKLKEIIEKIIHPKMVVGREVIPGFFVEMKERVEYETERIENDFRIVMMNIDSETKKKEYFLHHQLNAGRLQDKVFGYLLPKDRYELLKVSTEATADMLYRQIFHSLEGLLQYMENDFPDHFDTRVKVPDAQRWQLENEVRAELEPLKKQLKETGVEPGLIEVACMPLAELLISEREISYDGLGFLKTLYKKLSSFPHLANSKNATERFLKVLWRINYNSVWLYNYSVVEYDRTIKEAISTGTAIEYLKREEKMLKQVVMRTDVVFHRGQAAIIAQLLGWINEELKLLKEEEASAKLRKQLGKIATILGVEELGYGSRLLYGQGLFPEIEEGEFLEIVAAAFMTPKSKDISTESIKNKSGKPGPNAKSKVKGYLYEMARMVR